MERQLVEVDWVGIPLSVPDAVQSYLVEHPDSYYMPASRQWLYYLTREHGLLQVVHDFSMMDDDAVSEYIIGVLELLYQ